MNPMNDLDPYYIKAVTAMHSRDHLNGGKPALQTMLEEAIKAKTGVEKNLTPVIQYLFAKPEVDVKEEYKSVSGSVDESKTTSSSDNELELDLLKEDLMCIVCKGMDVAARNRLLECSDCHCLYHQECHQPVVTQQEAEGVWVCLNCKVKRIKKSPKSNTSSSLSSISNISSKSRSSTTSSLSPNYKSSTSKSSSQSSKSSSKSSSSKSSGSGSSSRHNSSTSLSSSSSSNSNLLHADKRMQLMKKKVAKLADKKKLPR